MFFNTFTEELSHLHQNLNLEYFITPKETPYQLALTPIPSPKP